MDRFDVFDLFLRQHGVARISQLRELGIAKSTISRARDRGFVADILPGVLRLTSMTDSFEMMAMAVQLQTMPDGFLSAFTALRIQGIWWLRDLPIWATVPVLAGPSISSSHVRTVLPEWVHRLESSWHHGHEHVDVVDGFRLQPSDSALFTIAGYTNDDGFERIAEQAWNLKLIAPGSFGEYVDTYRRSGRSGVARSVRWLESVADRERAIGSNFETDVLQAIRAVGLPEPEKQYEVIRRSGRPAFIDLAWPPIKLAIEPGHSRYHHGERERQDRIRDEELSELGWRTVRFDEVAREDLDQIGRDIAKEYRERALEFGIPPTSG